MAGIQLPTYDQPQVRQQALRLPAAQADAPVEAFGGGKAAEPIGGAVHDLAQTTLQIGQEEKQRADQVAFMEADKNLSQLQTKLQVDVSKLQGKDAFSAPDYVQKNWEKGIADLQGNLSNQDQKLAFAKSATNRWEELNRSTQVHVSQQKEHYDDQETEGWLSASKDAATLNAGDDQRIQTELIKQQAVVKDWAQRKGVAGTPIEDEKLKAVNSSTLQDIINARIDAGDTKGALQFFNDNKGSLTAADMVKATKTVEDAQTLDLGVATWGKIGSYRLSDGKPDEAKMEKAVMADPTLSTKQKEKVWDFVKARAGETISNEARQDAATDRSFMNTAIQARQQGQSLDDALKIVKKFGGDSYDQSVKADVIKKIYAPPTDSDPVKYLDLWEHIQANTATKAEIDEAVQKNLINVTDYRKLREDFFKINTEEKNPETKTSWDRIKVLAEENFGSNDVDKKKYLYDLHVAGQGKGADELWKMANDKLQSAPGTGWFGTNIFADKQWKTDVQREDAQNIAWGKAHEELGKDVTNAIGQSVLYSGKEKWNIADIDAFAANFGGYKNILPGTPAHNAIRSLGKHNQLATPANVNAVLSKYPDGNY